MLIERRFKKSAIGGSSVTLVPSDQEAENHPSQAPMSQIVVSTAGATPAAEFWNTVTTDGAEYLVTITRIS